MAEEAVCQSCGASGMQVYCPLCGEHRLDASQRSIQLLFGHLLREIASLDGKILKTLKALFLKPGLLSHAHWRGVRKPYMRPLTLFLLINLIYFLFSPLMDFHVPLEMQQHQPYGGWLVDTIESYQQQSGRSLSEVAIQYDAVTAVVAKSLVIISVPFLVPFVWLLNLSRKYYLVDHTVFALHLYCFLLAWPVLLNAVMGTLYFMLKGVVTVSLQGAPFLVIFLGPVLLYAIVAQRAMYGSHWVASLMKGSILLLAIVASHFVYRYIQFWIVWWQVT